MSVYGPASAYLLVGGRNLSGDTFNLDETIEQVLEEMHGLGDSWEEHTPVGLARTTLEATGGLYDDRTAGNVEALQAKGETLQVVDYGFMGMTLGASCVVLNGSYAAVWKRMAARDGLVKAHAVHRITGDYRRGRILSPLSALTTDPNPGLGTSVDNSTTVGLQAIPITSSSVANPTVITTTVPLSLIHI